jgi:hypothetical protein
MRATFLIVLLATIVASAGCGRGTNHIGLAPEFQPDKDTVLECKLQIKQSITGTYATVEFKNPTDHSEHVLKEVLLNEETLTGPPFVITKDGKYVLYTGAMVNKLPPTMEDADTLGPGESFERTIRLETYYDLSAPGEYEIVCDRLYEPGPDNFTHVVSNKVKFVVGK